MSYVGELGVRRVAQRFTVASGGAVIMMASATLVGSAGCDRDEEPVMEEVELGRTAVQQRTESNLPRIQETQQPREQPMRQDYPDPLEAKDQPTNDTATGATGRTAAAKPSDQAIARFAGAYGKIQDINQQYGTKISAAPSAEEAQEAQQNAAKAVATVLSDVGLSVDEYSEIAQRMQEDPELRQAIQQQMR